MGLFTVKTIIIILILVSLLFVSWYTKIFAFLLLTVAFLILISYFVLKKYSMVLLYFFSIIISLFLFEIALMFIIKSDYFGFVYFDPESEYAKSYFTRVDGFGYLPKPGVYSSRKITRYGDIIYDVTYTIADDGYRILPTEQKAQANIYGGSFVFGEGLNDDETLVHYMWEDHKFGAKSVGMHGYGLHQALYNIEQGITTSDGFNILLTAPWHSLRSACKPIYARGTPKYYAEEGYAKLVGTCDKDNFIWLVLSKSNVIKLLQQAIFNKEAEISDNDINLYLAIIRSIAEKTRKSGSKIVIAYIKASENMMKSTKWTNETLIKELSNISDGFVDVTLSDAAENLDRRYYIHELDRHPSALANRTRAKIIVNLLRKISLNQ